MGTIHDETGLRYMNVVNALRQKIENGDYQPGDLLPRQHDLANEYGVAYATLQKALDILDDEGYVVRKVGQGTYAALPEKFTQTALVVDDDNNVRMALVAALERSGWEIVEATSGEEGIEKFKEGDFGLVFLDLMMPGMNGAETFREIRALDPSAKAVIMTGFPDSELMAEALKVGTFSIMKKPFGLDDLRGVIDSLGGEA